MLEAFVDCPAASSPPPLIRQPIYLPTPGFSKFGSSVLKLVFHHGRSRREGRSRFEVVVVVVVVLRNRVDVVFRRSTDVHEPSNVHVQHAPSPHRVKAGRHRSESSEFGDERSHFGVLVRRSGSVPKFVTGGEASRRREPRRSDDDLVVVAAFAPFLFSALELPPKSAVGVDAGPSLLHVQQVGLFQR